MSRHRIRVAVNGAEREVEIDARRLLAHVIREDLGLTGTHIGCDSTSCGACTVLLDGRAVKSCTLLGVQADGRELTTIEGIAEGDRLHPLQEGFIEQHGLQCGFCTPGMILAAIPLLEASPDPGEDEIREAIAGNLCRCTGYADIVRSIQWAAARRRGEVAPAEEGAAPRWTPHSGPLGH